MWCPICDHRYVTVRQGDRLVKITELQKTALDTDVLATFACDEQQICCNHSEAELALPTLPMNTGELAVTPRKSVVLAYPNAISEPGAA